MNFKELTHLIHNSPVDVIFDVSRGPEFSEKVQRLLFCCGAYWVTSAHSQEQYTMVSVGKAIWVDVKNRAELGVPVLTHSGMDYVHQKLENSRPGDFRWVTPEELEPLLSLGNDFARSVATRVRNALKTHFPPNS